MCSKLEALYAIHGGGAEDRRVIQFWAVGLSRVGDMQSVRESSARSTCYNTSLTGFSEVNARDEKVAIVSAAAGCPRVQSPRSGPQNNVGCPSIRAKALSRTNNP